MKTDFAASGRLMRQLPESTRQHPRRESQWIGH
jgi:hypothetical protein